MREEEKATAQSLLDEATRIAVKDRKAVFLCFHASWCGWCHRLDAFLQKPEIKRIMEAHFVMVEMDVQENPDKKKLETPGAEKVMGDLGGAKSGLPFYAFLDPKGRKIADSNAMPKKQNIGYPGAPDEIQVFMGLLGQAAPRMTARERKFISDELTKNAPKPTR